MSYNDIRAKLLENDYQVEDTSNDGNNIVLFKSSALENKKLEILGITATTPLVLHGMNNITIFNDNAYTSFCLSAYETEIISCSGAITESGNISINGTFDLEIGGVKVLTDASPNDLINYLNNHNYEVEVIEERIESDSFFVSLFDGLSFSGDGWEFEAYTYNEEGLRTQLNSKGFAIHDIGDYMNCGDIYKIISTHMEPVTLKIKATTDGISVLDYQDSLDWTLSNIVTDSGFTKELTINFGPNTTSVSAYGMQATSEMYLGLAGEATYRISVNGEVIPNLIDSGNIFTIKADLDDPSGFSASVNKLNNSLSSYGISVSALTGRGSIFLRTSENNYKTIEISCLTGNTINPEYNDDGSDRNFSFELLEQTESLCKVRFCLVNPKTPSSGVE